MPSPGPPPFETNAAPPAPSEPAPTDTAPSEPTETQPTQPQPTEPQPTETQPTEPPTEPEAPIPAENQPTQDPPAERAPARATLTVNAAPWAEVVLDGRPLGNTPQRNVSIRAGRHTIVLRNPALANGEVRSTFEAESGASLMVIADLNASPPTVRVR
ncbi:MAG: PEGA domain-containing protein [Sandaracinaceae bacterium]